jgi:hypothetical protein
MFGGQIADIRAGEHLVKRPHLPTNLPARISKLTVSEPSLPPPFTVHSIAFAWRGNPDAIPLRSPATDRLVGIEPEWMAGRRSAVAAYVRGARPTIRVVFARSPGAGRVVDCRIAAEGDPGVAECAAALTFGPDGLSAPVTFRLSRRFANRLGIERLTWRWRASAGGVQHDIGTSEHEICLTWRRPRSPAAWAEPDAFPRDGAWVYLPLMQWTCEWAAGRRDGREICDALLAGLPRSGLRYAEPAWTVRDMLLKGGGYCGGWYRMFQAMAGAQGIRLERRAYLVNWEELSRDRVRWCALVVSAPGLNRTRPAEAASRFHDADERPISRSPVRSVTRRRYRFWGQPGKLADGHCVNFLRFRGRWYLYDASFQSAAGPLRGFSLPRSNPARAVPIGALGGFRRDYLDRAIDYMLGSLPGDGRLYQTVHPDPGQPDPLGQRVLNGLSVETSIVPDAGAAISFYWV